MHVGVTAIGVDRPGIVAAVSEVLYRLGANIEDSRMAILGGHFAMMLIVALPEDVDAPALERALEEPARALDLVVAVRPVAEAAAGHGTGEDHIVRVYGADRPGIVAQVSRRLADDGVNVRDLATHVVEGEPPVYVMLMEVTLPAGADAAAVEAHLKESASDLGVEVSMHPMEPETL